MSGWLWLVPLSWADEAWANEIELGVGRAALVQLDPPPTSVSITRSTVADVQAASPALLIIGRSPGKTTLTLVQGGQPVPYEVVVREDPMFDPTGPGVLPVGPKITVQPGSGAVCRLPFPPSGTTRLQTAAVQVEQFGSGTWFWLQPEKAGAYDIVFERTRGLPLVLTVASVPDEKPVIPAGCVGPEYTVTVPLGGEAIVPVGRPIDGLLVGHPSRVEVTPDGNRLRLRGLTTGRTSVLVRSNNADVPWLRTVVVTAPTAE